MTQECVNQNRNRRRRNQDFPKEKCWKVLRRNRCCDDPDGAGIYPMNYGKTEVKRQKVDRFLEFFYQLGYDRRTERKLTGNIGLATFYSREKIYKRTISCMNGAESSFEPMNIQTFWLVLRSYEVRVNVLCFLFSEITVTLHAELEDMMPQLQ